jgi:hypothetical protein
VAKSRVLFEQLEKPVEQAHQPVAKLLLGPVPLAVPVGVGHENHMLRGQGTPPFTSYHHLARASGRAARGAARQRATREIARSALENSTLSMENEGNTDDAGPEPQPSLAKELSPA